MTPAQSFSDGPIRSIVLRKDEDGNISTSYEDTSVDPSFLGEGDVLIEVGWSSLNYKDAMALEGNPGVVRTWPLIPGIDAVGTVIHSSDPRFGRGDEVVLNGTGLGENRHGGYTQRLSVPAESLLHIPFNFSAQQVGALGTAGLTAALSVNALVDQGVKPEDGQVLVTGSTGGVGSIALHLLNKLGYETVAVTGRREAYAEYLTALGASDIIDRAELGGQGKPLQKGRWAGVVDSVGSHTLVNAIAQTKPNGVVTACGMAQGPDLPGTVLPFILRGVQLLGINSVEASRELRRRAWALLSEHLDTSVLDDMTTVVELADVASAGADLMSGKLHGRTAVRVH
ncbi:Zn-NADPH:quinone dehydrogenase [Corynebacterium deserti GIMN1.010]|uniref:Zn-NADPH:quinone dehydrogenase n=1 Tax=Corynebacterium deserti GIMN1.010 TaxID=931089 RepID=A0A0M5IRH1_9CORY|nr:MDR family oxidoreductase [Corynebacterium deserti]ALC06661.1 Zn-NADPH:quinone dehydrogenase [Corynebacterium deserti GIMN1.010]